jgi:hypothetical protein
MKRQVPAAESRGTHTSPPVPVGWAHLTMSGPCAVGDLALRPGDRARLRFHLPRRVSGVDEMGSNGNGRMSATSEDCLYPNIWTPA